MAVWGDKINLSQLKTGQNLNISFDIESREFNGRWYTDVKVFKLETGSAVNSQGHSNYEEYVAPSANDEPMPF
jgi:hypothetical protein